MSGCAQDPDPSGCVLDHREHMQPGAGQGDRFEEVTGEECVRLGAQKGRPGAGGPLGRWWDAGLLQNLPDRGRGHLDAEDEQFAVQAPVAPCRILGGQAQDQGADGAYGARSAWALGPGPGGVAAGGQVAVPSRNGVRPHRQPHPTQHLRRQTSQQHGRSSCRGCRRLCQSAGSTGEVDTSELSRSASYQGG